MPKTVRKKRLAIFDIDGTIFRSSLLIELVRELVAQRLFPETTTKQVERLYLAWVDRKGNYEDYIMAVVGVYQQHIVGCSKKDFDRVVQKVIRFHRNRQYRFTHDLVGRLRREGYFLIAVSGSPHDIVRIFAREMRFNAAFGVLYDVEKGRFTGQIVKNNSVMNKARVIHEYLAETGMAVDLKNSIAVGDTEGDIPTLSLVGKPIAFNPNQVLARWARRKQVPIVVERKDVIYGLYDFDFIKHQ